MLKHERENKQTKQQQKSTFPGEKKIFFWNQNEL